MTAVTPCRGHSKVYDAALHPHTPTDKRHQARQIAAALCARCPIADTCPDRITAPASYPRRSRARKDKSVTVTDITPPAPPKLDSRDVAPPSSTEALIRWGAAHSSSRMQALAGKARSALADLRQAAERETKVADAEARVKRLKAQLDNAQKDLASAKGTTAPRATEQAAEDYAAIRAWARESGIEVGAVGRPKREVIDAYHAAQHAA